MPLPCAVALCNRSGVLFSIPKRWSKLTLKLIILFMLFLMPVLAFASSPANFGEVIGGSISCDDQVDAAYLIRYMRQFFGQPEKTEGGAYWWRLNEKLFDTPILFVFVSQDGSGYDFVGATFKDSPQALMKRVTRINGALFFADGHEIWESSRNSMLLRYHDRVTPSKMYCAGARTVWGG